MRTEKEILKRIKEQKEYIKDLNVRYAKREISSERYLQMNDSAVEICLELDTELLEIRSLSAEALLRESVFAFNSIPNTKYGDKSTYWLASQIEKYLKAHE
jgi:hypothetical protein